MLPLQLLLKFYASEFPSLLHLWNFLLLLPALDRISRFRVCFRFQSLSSKCFRFHKKLTASTASASTSLLSMKQLIVFSVKKNRQVYFVSYFIWIVLSIGHGMEWNWRQFFRIPYWQFSSILFPFHTKNLPFHIPSYLKFSSILNSYFHTKEILDWKQCNVYFAALRLCNVASNRSWMCVNNTKMQQPVSGMHVGLGLMHRHSQDFRLWGRAKP